MDGIIIVDKPQGWTSFDVVAKIRNLSREKKVGHSGTLDPMATGVLPIFLGKATKSIQYFLNGDKGYEGEMILGAKTDTGDADGEIIFSNPQSPITDDEIARVFKKYVGEIEQVPPMYSAVKIKGKRLYELARQGIEVKREARKITIYDLRLMCNDSQNATAQRLSFSVLCSKGTYVRQLAVDMGDDWGCGAYLSKLVRTYAQPFHISQAHNLETIVTLAKIGQLSTVVMPVDVFLPAQAGAA